MAAARGWRESGPGASKNEDRPLLRIVSGRKRYGDTLALEDASIELWAGQLHAVVGENGAGKSTLMKVAAGIVPRDAGELSAFGTTPARYDARAAEQLGIAMVQQHFALFDDMSVLENIVVGREPMLSFGRIDLPLARKRANDTLRDLGTELPLDAQVHDLGVGDKQRLEIARALFQDARLVILDEPTAILTPVEVETLYRTLQRLAKGGRGVVVVTHKLAEVEAHADVVTVMRRGRTLGTRKVARGAEVRRLATELIGGEPLPDMSPRVPASGEVALTVDDVWSGAALRGVSLDVKRGEIVGVAGVLGNGQSELVEVLGGLRTLETGRVEGRAIEVVHEDRQTSGLVLDASVAQNLVLGQLETFSRRGVVDEGRVDRVARERIARFDIRPADPNVPARALSGGNQQKIVLARALASEPKVLVVAHPTRGVDLFAARSIHKAITAAADDGAAVLVVSADLTELRLLASRIVVMARGRVVASFPPSATDDEIGTAMLGEVAQSA